MEEKQRGWLWLVLVLALLWPMAAQADGSEEPAPAPAMAAVVPTEEANPNTADATPEAREGDAGHKQLTSTSETQGADAEPPIPGDGSETGTAPAEAQDGRGDKASPAEDPANEGEVEAEPTPEDPYGLDALEAEMQAKKDDPEALAALQKAYQEALVRYYEGILKDAGDKLDEKTLARISDNARIKTYYALRQRKEGLDVAREKGQLNRQALAEFAEALAAFKVPRALRSDEQAIAKDVAKHPALLFEEPTEAPYLEGVAEYRKAEAALKDALDPEKEGLEPEALAALNERYQKSYAQVLDWIQKSELKGRHTKDGKTEIKAFLIGDYGEIVKELNEETYYVPQNRPFTLLLQLGKDNTKGIKVTLNGLGDPHLKSGKPYGLVFLNEKMKAELKQDPETKAWYFETPKGENFAYAQLKLQLAGLVGDFHEGFDLRIDAQEETDEPIQLRKAFRVTKKGYADAADLYGPGGNANRPGEVDGGPVAADQTVQADGAKVVGDFMVELQKAKGWIDEVLVNHYSSDALPLSTLKIRFQLPSFNGAFAEYVHRSGLVFDQEPDGHLSLELKVEDFGGNLIRHEDGRLFVKQADGSEVELVQAKLQNVILEKEGRQVYIDADGKAHPVEVKKTLATADGSHRIDGERLLDAEGEVIGTFEKDRFEKDGLTYLRQGDKVLVFSKAQPVMDGHGVNKKANGQTTADPSITRSPEGDQIVIPEEDGRQAYAGTVVQDAIYDRAGKRSYEKALEGRPYMVIDGTGKVQQATIDLAAKTVQMGDQSYTLEEKDGQLRMPEGSGYRFIQNGVIKAFKDGAYLISGFRYVPGPSLLDKYGKLQDIQVQGNAQDGYRFQKGDETRATDNDKVVIAGTNPLLIDSKNRVSKAGDYEVIDGPFYFDGKRYVAIGADDANRQGGVYYQDLKQLEFQAKEERSYQKDGQPAALPGDARILYGATDPKEVFAAADRFYLKEGERYRSLDKEPALLSEKALRQVVQIHPDGREIVGDDIEDLLRRTRFGLRFPGFLAGKEMVYRLNGEIEAAYVSPQPDGTMKDVSIFKDGKRSFERAFTLKLPAPEKAVFKKVAPAELARKMDYTLFNLLYRDSDDRKRDEILHFLFGYDFGKPTLSAEEKAYKAERDLLAAAFQKAYGATLKMADGKLVAEKNGKPFEIPRALLWRLEIANDDPGTYPEDKDSQIVIDDTGLDPRLVYDEIILNDDRAHFEQAKQTAKDEKRDFEGDERLFSIDDVASLEFGVNPFFVEDRYFPVGKDFVIGRAGLDAIMDGLAAAQEGVFEYTQAGVTYRVTRDAAKGQLRIRIINAFYDKDGQSPVQKAHEAGLKKLTEAAQKGQTPSNKDELIKYMEKLVDLVYDPLSTCSPTLKEQYRKAIEGKTDLDPAKELASLNELLAAYHLFYADEKGPYRFDDGRFNALRIVFKESSTVGGLYDPRKSRHVLVSTVLAPRVDVPYTDSYGRVLTNRQKYVQAHLKAVLKEKSISRSDFESKEDTYREVMAEVRERLAADSFVELVTGKSLIESIDGTGLHYGYQAKKGNEMDAKALSIDSEGKKQMEADGRPINDFYIGGKGLDALGLSAQDASPIYLIGYYLAKEGHNAAFFENRAQFHLFRDGIAPSLFEEADSWKRKRCYYGTLPCLIEHGETKDSGLNPGRKADLEGGQTKAKITIDNQPTPNPIPKENPGLDKSANKTHVDMDLEPEKPKTVDYTVTATVDKLSQADQKLALAHAHEKEISEGTYQVPAGILDGYNERGYYVVHDGLLIDLLPSALQLGAESKITVEADRAGLMAGGANATFADEAAFEIWKKGIQLVYTDDLARYMDGLSTAQKASLAKLLEERKLNGRGQQAVLAWLPAFEAPHGSRDQLTLKLGGLVIDRDRFADYGDGLVNTGGYGNAHGFLYGEKKITLSFKKEGSVDKYLRIYDADGQPITQPGEWFKGNVTLHFGDRFDYRIAYKRQSNINNDTGIADTSNKDWMLDDILPQTDGEKGLGLRPVLRDFATAPEGFEVRYFVQGSAEPLRKEDLEAGIKAGTLRFADVIGVRMQAGPAGFPDGFEAAFVLPMQIPSLDVISSDGTLHYVGRNGEEILGDAAHFFDMDRLAKGERLAAANQVDGSNEVVVTLDRERFLKLVKHWRDAAGRPLKGKLPEATFDVMKRWQDGAEVKQEKVGELVLNEANGYTAILDHLPTLHRETIIHEDGRVEVRETVLSYEVVEHPLAGFTGKLLPLAETDLLGYLQIAENTQVTPPPDHPGRPPRPTPPPKTPPGQPPTPGVPPLNPPPTPGVPPLAPPVPPSTPEESIPPTTPRHEKPVPKTGLPTFPLAGGCLVLGALLRRKDEAR